MLQLHKIRDWSVGDPLKPWAESYDSDTGFEVNYNVLEAIYTDDYADQIDPNRPIRNLHQQDNILRLTLNRESLDNDYDNGQVIPLVNDTIRIWMSPDNYEEIWESPYLINSPDSENPIYDALYTIYTNDLDNIWKAFFYYYDGDVSDAMSGSDADSISFPVLDSETLTSVSGFPPSVCYNGAIIGNGDNAIHTGGTAIIGGSPPTVINNTYKYNGASWSSGPNLNRTRHIHSCVGNYVAAGLETDSTSSGIVQCEYYNGTTFSDLSSLIFAVGYSGHADQYLLFGGYMGSSTVNTYTQILDESTNIWSISTAQLNNSGAICSGGGNNEYAFKASAYNEDTDDNGSTEEYNGTSWIVLDSDPPFRQTAVLFSNPNQVYTFGDIKEDSFTSPDFLGSTNCYEWNGTSWNIKSFSTTRVPSSYGYSSRSTSSPTSGLICYSSIEYNSPVFFGTLFEKFSASQTGSIDIRVGGASLTQYRLFSVSPFIFYYRGDYDNVNKKDLYVAFGEVDDLLVSRKEMNYIQDDLSPYYTPNTSPSEKVISAASMNILERKVARALRAKMPLWEQQTFFKIYGIPSINDSGECSGETSFRIYMEFRGDIHLNDEEFKTGNELYELISNTHLVLHNSEVIPNEWLKVLKYSALEPKFFLKKNTEYYVCIVENSDDNINLVPIPKNDYIASSPRYEYIILFRIITSDSEVGEDFTAEIYPPLIDYRNENRRLNSKVFRETFYNDDEQWKIAYRGDKYYSEESIYKYNGKSWVEED